MRFTLSDSMLSELFEVIDKQIKRFTTSADVVMKASGLRIEAIRAIAREVGKYNSKILKHQVKCQRKVALQIPSMQ